MDFVTTDTRGVSRQQVSKKPADQYLVTTLDGLVRLSYLVAALDGLQRFEVVIVGAVEVPRILFLRDVETAKVVEGKILRQLLCVFQREQISKHAGGVGRRIRSRPGRGDNGRLIAVHSTFRGAEIR